ncbi:MAG: efflux RND transporter periplasmic adaptor subunit [Methylococcaceae bacterium]|nr:efflux RND transporter periplasmic adaptor subunit [Methylococcaceae bacterium]
MKLAIAALLLVSFGQPAMALEGLIKLDSEQAGHIGVQTLLPVPTASVPLVRAPARVSLPPQNEYVVSAPQGGLVTKVDVALGVRVANGQPLARIESPSLVGLQRSFLDAVNTHELARNKLARDKTLLAEGIISTMRWQETRSDYERTATALSEAEQVLTIAGIDAADISRVKKSHRIDSHYTVRSPADGVVLERMAVVGQRLDPMTPLFRIGKLDELWLEIDMPQERLPEIRLDDRIQVEGLDLHARITHVGQNITPGTQSTLVRAVLENRGDPLKPGQHVTVVLLHASTDKLFKVPLTAVVSQEGRDYVFVRVEGGFAPRRVAIASRDSHQAIVHEGLTEADAVAVQGVAALKAAWVGIGSEE